MVVVHLENYSTVHTNVSIFQGEKVKELRVVKESALTWARKEFTSGSDAVPQGKVRKLNVFFFLFLSSNPSPSSSS